MYLLKNLPFIPCIISACNADRGIVHTCREPEAGIGRSSDLAAPLMQAIEIEVSSIAGFAESPFVAQTAVLAVLAVCELPTALVLGFELADWIRALLVHRW